MDLTIHGRLAGAAARPAPYGYDDGVRFVDVAIPPDGGESRVDLRWEGISGDVDEAERQLKGWFSAELAACALTTGVASGVHWTGRTIKKDDGTTLVGATLASSLRSIREHPAPLGTYTPLADAIRAQPETAEAARHWHIAARLMEDGDDIALGEAYLAVEGLVIHKSGDETLKSWAAFGDALSAAGRPFAGDDLRQLYASCQWGRHSQQTRAVDTLKAIGRPKLEWWDACVTAAKVVEAYARARQSGAM